MRQFTFQRNHYDIGWGKIKVAQRQRDGNVEKKLR